MKKGRRATENTPSNVSSDSPSTPDYEANFQENALSDEFSSGLDFKSIPGKSKHRAGWTDEPVRSASSGKYASHALNSLFFRIFVASIFIDLFVGF